MATAQQQDNVVQLPTRLNRLNSADQLIQEWAEIQKICDNEARVMALFNWRARAENHSKQYC